MATKAPQPQEPDIRPRFTFEELAERQGVKLGGRPIEDYIAPDIWESDDEVDRFIQETYEARRRDLAS